jgi:hypothetical protein
MEIQGPSGVGFPNATAVRAFDNPNADGECN